MAEHEIGHPLDEIAQGLANALDKIAADTAEEAYYLIAKDDAERWEGNECHLYVYVGCDFCMSCAGAITDLIARKVGEDDDKEVLYSEQDGESDNTKACHWCGCLLHYYLTDAGAGEEMAHFDEHPPSVPIPPGDAYALARILDNGSADSDFIEKVTGWVAAHKKDAGEGKEATCIPAC